MVESYSVEASLEWKTNVPQVLREMMRGFEEVDTRIASIKGTLAGFGAELKELTGNNRGVAALARQFEKLKLPGSVVTEMKEMRDALAGAATAQTEMARAAVETAKAWQETIAATRRFRAPAAASGSGGRHATRWGHGEALDAAMGAQIAGDAGMGLFQRGSALFADVQMQQVMAQSDKKVTDAVVARANSLIATLQKQYPALTQAEGLTVFRNTMGIFGDPNESLAAMPGAIRLQQLYQLAPLGRGGTGGQEVQAAEKAGDALQAFIDPKTQKLDTGLYQQWMDLQARSYQAGGGLMDAKGWLAFARTSRAAGIGLNQRALEEVQALLEMSPGRTGTALMSAFQVFGASTSHMTDKNRAAWADAGLLDKSGDIKGRSLYQSDPFQWVWSDMLPALAKKGVQTRDQVLRWLTDHGQRSTVAGLLADIAIGQTPITNTAAKMERQDPNLVDKLTQTDMGKIQALHAAETNFFVALGKFSQGPGIALLTDLTKALNKLTDEMEAHPETAKRLIEIGGGLALVSKIAGDSAMAAIFVGGPLVRGVSALASALIPFRVGGVAEVALATVGGAGAGSLFGLASGIVAVGAAMAGLPPLMKWLLTPDGAPANTGSNKFHGNTNEPQSPSWWTNFWNGSAAAPGANSQRGRAATVDGAPDGTVTLPAITLHSTHNHYIDGKLSKTTHSTKRWAQGGTTGFDGSMSLYPAGPPNGGF